MATVTTTMVGEARGEVGEAEASTAPTARTEARRPGGRRPLSLSGVVVVGLVAWAVRVGMHPLHDNSFFTHLATGRLILDRGGVPRVDPYSFTAHGHAWTVQSWLASTIYASVEEVAGLHGIQLLVTACTVGLALLVWRLTREASSIAARILVAGLAMVVGVSAWVERPLLFGLLGFGAVLLAAEDALDPRWLVPVFWVWVNTHGSFPLGVGLLVLVAAGTWLDTRRRPDRELRVLAWGVVGTLAGAINPLGPKLLTFPLELLHKTEAFKMIVEWQPPKFQDYGERAFLLQLVLAVLLLLRRRSWRVALVLVVFAAAALTSARNVPVASIALLPGMAWCLVGLGSLGGEDRKPAYTYVGALLGVLAALLLVQGLRGPTTDLEDYPTGAAHWMRQHGLLDRDARVVSRDFVGNYFEARFGPDEVRTFIDDRVDMYPLPVVRDYAALIRPGRDWQGVLRRWKATAVLWDTDSDLGRSLRRARGWRIVHREHGWLVAVPR